MARVLSLASLAFIPLGCGEEETVALRNQPYQPWADGEVTVIGSAENGPEPGLVATGPTTAEGCLQLGPDECVPINRDGKYCSTDSGPVDVIRNGSQVVEVVCYEDTDGDSGPSIVIDGTSDGSIDVPQTKNGSVLTFDPSTDGKPVPGNVQIDANNVTLYGNGPDNSIIEGNLTIAGNNARIRGVRVKGNVEFGLNTGAMVLSVVEGNVQVGSNNVLLAGNDIFGNLEVTGNNAILISNRVASNWKISGHNAVCSDNHAFRDQDEDRFVDESETGAALSCSN